MKVSSCRRTDRPTDCARAVCAYCCVCGRPVHAAPHAAAAKAHARARTHPEQLSSSATEPRKAGHVVRASAAANSTRRPLHYGEHDDPCKMAYSRMAFLSRACVLPNLPANSRHTGTLAGSRRACTSSSSSSAGAALVRSHSVAPFLDDGLEEDGAGRLVRSCKTAQKSIWHTRTHRGCESVHA